ncbi:hypothetical protein U9M48_043509, partial [Paspalum notatum var. saurae]
ATRERVAFWPIGKIPCAAAFFPDGKKKKKNRRSGCTSLFYLGCPDKNAAASFLPSPPPSPPSSVVPGFVHRTASPSTPLPHRLLQRRCFQGSTDLRPIALRYSTSPLAATVEGESIFAYRDINL